MSLGVYRSVLATPHAAKFAAACFVARVPMAMRAIACLMLVSALTGSYALAGAVSGVLGGAESVGYLLTARQADRWGQRPVILVSTVVHVTALVALVATVSWGAPGWTYFTAAVVAGLATVPYGSFVRARWAVAAGSPDALQSAYALEAVLDELIYVVGPLVAVALATQVWRGAGVFGAAALVTAGGLALAAQRRTAPPPSPRGTAIGGRILRQGGMWVVAAVYFVVGTYASALEPAVIAFARAHGAPGFAGVLLALITVGSALAGAGYGARKWSWSRPRLLVAVTTLLCAGSVPLIFADSVAVLAGCILLAGIGLSPVLVTASALISSLVGRSALNTAFAAAGSAASVGTAVGTAVSGVLLDWSGVPATFGFATAVAGLGIVVSVAGRKALAVPAPDAEPEPAPAAG
ncbi:MFS family permease [Amycolatopsis lexingtonensis]|uniref:MFS family permease n=1 Tax=Amycolatopsis lexingtonensis TaxID=218822 RepID=A0ABR9IFV5_9PSEU|nr:MFS transporter [Amycolatopsis lexingtonensis]MBE1501832.1 MFS family permease [Amycolatopsis lexingtonensis]